MTVGVWWGDTDLEVSWLDTGGVGIGWIVEGGVRMESINTGA